MNPMNQRISEIGVVPVIKLSNPERDAAPMAKALCAGGVPVAEVTFRAAGADKAIRLMKEACPEMIVGAGTVTAAAGPIWSPPNSLRGRSGTRSPSCAKSPVKS